MKEITVAIVTDDHAYGEALVRGLRYRSRSFMMTIHSTDRFTERWKKEGLAYRKSFDLVLWDGEEGEKIRGDNLIWITDRMKEASQAETACGAQGAAEAGRDRYAHTIYRYETASTFHGRMMDILDETGKGSPVDDRDTRGETDTKVFAFGSWKGGAGCTTACRAVGQELVRFFGKRILWMTLDGIEPAELDETNEQDTGRAGGVDRFLYSVLSRKEGAADIERFLHRDGYGLENLRPSMGRNPLPQLGEDEAAKILRTVMRSGIFDGILIDAGDCCSDGTAEMIAFADKVCLVGKGDEGSRRARYLSWIENSIDHRRTGTDGEGGGRLMILDDLPAGEFDEEILLEGRFGKNIHALAEALWYNKVEKI